MPSYYSKKGKVTALSHAIYIQPKSIFVELSTSDETCNILLEVDREKIKKWRDMLKMREWIQIDNLKKVMIKGHSKPVFQATADSEIKIMIKGIAGRLESSLYRFQGQVIEDSWSSCGFYTLDNGVILCLAHVKQVTNVPTVKRGDSIFLCEAHRTLIGKKVVLHLCCRGNLSNLSTQDQERLPFPKTSQEEKENSLQHCALEYNCNIVWLFSLFKLTKSIVERFSDILPTENIVRRKGDFKGITALLFDHLSSYFAQDSRILSREFLDHDSSCTVGMKPGESSEKIEEWRLNTSYIEEKCNHAKLWTSSDTNTADPEETAETNPQKKVATKHSYWKHEIATVYTTSEPVLLLVGILTFKNGLWQLKDGKESIPCILSDRMLHQFRDRCVFATAFHVHRETFLVEGSGKPEKRIYLSIDELHPASLPVSEPKVSPEAQPARESIRFLALSKSMPLMIFSNNAAKLKIFGFLVTATLYGASHPSCPESPWQPKKKMRTVRETGANDEPLPSNCVFAFSHQQCCVDFSALNEGKVYEICLSKQELFKQRIYIPSLKEIPQSYFRNHAYLIPDHIGIYPVLYNLPRTELIMQGDVLSVTECLTLEDVSQTVSLRGWIVDRLHCDSRFESERMAQRSFEVYQGNWLGIPGNKKILLRIGSSPDYPSHKIDVYLSLNDRQVYPYGLFRGSEVEFTWLYMRKTKNTSRVYCTSTLLTGIRVLQVTSNLEKDAWPKIDKLKNSSIGRRFISQLQSAEFKVSCTVVGSVRYVHKLAIRNVCFGCQSQVKNGVCSYVGCCWAGEPRTKLDLKAWCTVEDGSGQALLFIGGESCQRWLHFSPGIWNVLEEQILPHEGEFVYLSRSYIKDASLPSRIISCYCDTSAYLRRPLSMIVRKMFDNEVKPSNAYYFQNPSSIRLFCVDVKELDPSACALELTTAMH